LSVLGPITYNPDVCQAVKRIQPSKSVGLDDIPAFVMKQCSWFCIQVLKFIFNLSPPQEKFPTLRRRAAFVPGL
jgi:hypothetical protein